MRPLTDNTKDPYRGFTSWSEAARWFAAQLERFHESDQANISERSALLTLIHDLEVMQSRLNASAGKPGREFTKSVPDYDARSAALGKLLEGEG